MYYIMYNVYLFINIILYIVLYNVQCLSVYIIFTPTQQIHNVDSISASECTLIIINTTEIWDLEARLKHFIALL